MTETKMKPSGFGWIGDIPNEWIVCRIKDSCNIARGGSPRPIDLYMSDDETGVNWIKIGDTKKGYKFIDETGQKIISAGIAKSRTVNAGDLLLTNSMSFGQPYILNIDGCIHDGWLVFSKYGSIEQNFLYYLLMSELCKQQFDSSVSGSVVENLNIVKVGRTMVFLPPKNEQRSIVSFLDDKCSNLDGIIKDLESQIEIAEKYKKSVITEAVTKGLNPDVEMKDSGVDWIGMIPKRWSITRTKYRVRIMNGKEILNEDGEIPVYGSGGLFKYTDKWLHEGMSVLLGRKGTVDAPQLVDGKFWTVDTAFYTSMKNEILVEYFYYLACCFDYEKYQTGSTVPSMTQTALGNIYIPKAGIDEQKEIVCYLDKKCNEIDVIIADKKSQLETIKKYKNSLIYEYVTGEKRVEQGVLHE